MTPPSQGKLSRAGTAFAQRHIGELVAEQLIIDHEAFLQYAQVCQATRTAASQIARKLLASCQIHPAPCDAILREFSLQDRLLQGNGKESSEKLKLVHPTRLHRCPDAPFVELNDVPACRLFGRFARAAEEKHVIDKAEGQARKDSSTSNVSPRFKGPKVEQFEVIRESVQVHGSTLVLVNIRDDLPYREVRVAVPSGSADVYLQDVIGEHGQVIGIVTESEDFSSLHDVYGTGQSFSLPLWTAKQKPTKWIYTSYHEEEYLVRLQTTQDTVETSFVLAQICRVERGDVGEISRIHHFDRSSFRLRFRKHTVFSRPHGWSFTLSRGKLHITAEPLITAAEPEAGEIISYAPGRTDLNLKVHGSPVPRATRATFSLKRIMDGSHSSSTDIDVDPDQEFSVEQVHRLAQHQYERSEPQDGHGHGLQKKKAQPRKILKSFSPILLSDDELFAAAFSSPNKVILFTREDVDTGFSAPITVSFHKPVRWLGKTPDGVAIFHEQSTGKIHQVDLHYDARRHSTSIHLASVADVVEVRLHGPFLLTKTPAYSPAFQGLEADEITSLHWLRGFGDVVDVGNISTLAELFGFDTRDMISRMKAMCTATHIWLCLLSHGGQLFGFVGIDIRTYTVSVFDLRQLRNLAIPPAQHGRRTDDTQTGQLIEIRTKGESGARIGWQAHPPNSEPIVVVLDIPTRTLITLPNKYNPAAQGPWSVFGRHGFSTYPDGLERRAHADAIFIDLFADWGTSSPSIYHARIPRETVELEGVGFWLKDKQRFLGPVLDLGDRLASSALIATAVDTSLFHLMINLVLMRERDSTCDIDGGKPVKP